MFRRAAVLVVLMAMPWAGCKPSMQRNPKAAEVQESPPAVAEEVAKTEHAPEATAAPAATPISQTINKNAQAVIIGYHRVVEKVRRPDTEISPADFEAQMQQLKEQGVSVIPMQDLLAWKRGEKDIPAKSAVITFDDGWKQQYEVAWPILKKYGYPFTMFIYTDYVKGGPKSGGESMTWQQLAEMRDAGVDIEGHTISHHDLRGGKMAKANPPEYEAWLWNELNGSKQMIEQKLGVKINALALPYGFYNAHVLDVAKKAGYEAVFDVYGQKIVHGSPSILMGRYVIQSNKPKIFADAVRFSGATGAEMPAVAELASPKLAVTPPDGEVISNPQPLIKANIASMGQIDPGSLTMRVSSLGAVPAKLDPQTQEFSYRPERKLREGLYTVIVSATAQGKKVETRWGFTLDLHGNPRHRPAP